MTTFKQRLQIDNGYITAWNVTAAGSSSIWITDASDWGATPEISRNSKEKLFSSGSYMSKAGYFRSKYLALSFAAAYPNTISINNLKANIIELGERINDPVNITMTYYENDKEVLREVLSCYPDAKFLEEWNPMSNAVEFTIMYIAPDPYKTRYLNGSSIPEAKKRV